MIESPDATKNTAAALESPVNTCTRKKPTLVHQMSEECDNDRTYANLST